MKGITYRFKGLVAAVNEYNRAINSWDSPKEFTVYAASAGEACEKVERSLGSPGGEYEWDFRISNIDEVVYP